MLLWYYQENITHSTGESGPGRAANGVAIAQLSASVANAPEALAYGRTQCQTVVVEGRSRKRGGHRVVMENWQSC